MDIAEKIAELQGPILVLGASGFVGANLLRAIARVRPDVWGTSTTELPWRLADIRPLKIFVGRFGPDLTPTEPSDFKTVFNCLAYGGYSWQKDADQIYWTNFDLTRRIVTDLMNSDVATYVHAGSSSEYGDNASSPRERDFLAVNSDYAVSKAAASAYLYYVGKKRHFPCVNLRLYSVYGPWEDERRLIPSVIQYGMRGMYPPLVDPSIGRDFVLVDDVVEAFIDAARNMVTADYGESFNIGTGVCTSIGEVAAAAKALFNLTGEPAYTLPPRSWDVCDWKADPGEAKRALGWEARTDFETGLRRTLDWERTRHGQP